MRRWLVIGSLVPAFAACGTLLQSGTDDGTPAPAGSDASADGASSSTADGASDGIASLPASCPPTALLCDRFDDGLAAWSDAASPFAIATEADRGNFARATFSSALGTRFMRRDVPGAPTKLRFSFSLRVNDPGYTNEPDTANYAVAGFESAAPATGLFVALYLSRGSASGVAAAQVTGASTYESFRPGPFGALSYGTWHVVTIELELGTSGSFAFSIDGVRASSTTLRSDPKPVSIVLGSKRPNSPPPPVSADWDDILVEPF